MIDIKLIRENPELVKENMKKKFQDHKLILVDEVLELDRKNRESKLKSVLQILASLSLDFSGFGNGVSGILGSIATLITPSSLFSKMR